MGQFIVSEHSGNLDVLTRIRSCIDRSGCWKSTQEWNSIDWIANKKGSHRCVVVEVNGSQDERCSLLKSLGFSDRDLKKMIAQEESA